MKKLKRINMVTMANSEKFLVKAQEVYRWAGLSNYYLNSFKK
ncbi:hypothetical protein [Desulfosporosinus orientis]|nr:hypothetical protein [Desulfosporosinus orientis]